MTSQAAWTAQLFSKHLHSARCGFDIHRHVLSTCSLLSLATVTPPNSCESILNASKVQHEHACCAVIFTVRVVCVVLAQQPTTAIHNCSCARVRQTPQTLLRTHCDLILKLDTWDELLATETRVRSSKVSQRRPASIESVWISLNHIPRTLGRLEEKNSDSKVTSVARHCKLDEAAGMAKRVNKTATAHNSKCTQEQHKRFAQIYLSIYLYIYSSKSKTTNHGYQ